MSSCGAFIRNVNDIRAAIPEIRAELELFDSYQADSPETLRELSINRDILLTQLVDLSAVLGYAEDLRTSRGSYLITDRIPDGRAPVPVDTEHFTQNLPVTTERQGQLNSDGAASDRYRSATTGSRQCGKRTVRKMLILPQNNIPWQYLAFLFNHFAKSLKCRILYYNEDSKVRGIRAKQKVKKESDHESYRMQGL